MKIKINLIDRQESGFTKAIKQEIQKICQFKLFDYQIDAVFESVKKELETRYFHPSIDTVTIFGPLG